MRRRSTARTPARSRAAAAARWRVTSSLAVLLERDLEQPGEHIAQPRLVEIADHAAVVHNRDRASLFRDNHSDGVRLLGDALRRTVARAIAPLTANILAKRQHDIGG